MSGMSVMPLPLPPLSPPTPVLKFDFRFQHLNQEYATSLPDIEAPISLEQQPYLETRGLLPEGPPVSSWLRGEWSGSRTVATWDGSTGDVLRREEAVTGAFSGVVCPTNRLMLLPDRTYASMPVEVGPGVRVR